MLSTLARGLLFTFFCLTRLAESQSASTSEYVGYNLTLEGDNGGSAIYSTDDTDPNAGVQYPNPDVYLNASVHVTEIDLEVDNLTAKINLDAQVLSLLQFNAGVNLAIDEVELLIQNVNAKVLLEARLENLVKMINSTLNSLDLNPVIATLGQDVGNIVNTTVGNLTGDSGSGSGSSTLSARSYGLENNILYSTNNYRANKHTNRVLAQNGDLVDHFLNNDGHTQGQQVIGDYLTEMTYTGYENKVLRDGEEVTEREYTYVAAHGLSALCAIYIGGAGNVVGTQVLAESGAQGSSTLSED